MPRSLQSSFHLSTSSLRQGHGAPEGLSPSYCVLCLRDVACNRLCSAYLICAREHRQVLGHARKELLHRDWSSFSGRQYHISRFFRGEICVNIFFNSHHIYGQHFSFILLMTVRRKKYGACISQMVKFKHLTLLNAQIYIS